MKTNLKIVEEKYPAMKELIGDVKKAIAKDVDAKIHKTKGVEVFGRNLKLRKDKTRATVLQKARISKTVNYLKGRIEGMEEIKQLLDCPQIHNPISDRVGVKANKKDADTSVPQKVVQNERGVGK